MSELSVLQKQFVRLEKYVSVSELLGRICQCWSSECCCCCLPGSRSMLLSQALCMCCYGSLNSGSICVACPGSCSMLLSQALWMCCYGPLAGAVVVEVALVFEKWCHRYWNIGVARWCLNSGAICVGTSVLELWVLPVLGLWALSARAHRCCNGLVPGDRCPGNKFRVVEGGSVHTDYQEIKIRDAAVSNGRQYSSSCIGASQDFH